MMSDKKYRSQLYLRTIMNRDGPIIPPLTKKQIEQFEDEEFDKGIFANFRASLSDFDDICNFIQLVVKKYFSDYETKEIYQRLFYFRLILEKNDQLFTINFDLQDIRALTYMHPIDAHLSMKKIITETLLGGSERWPVTKRAA